MSGAIGATGCAIPAEALFGNKSLRCPLSRLRHSPLVSSARAVGEALGMVRGAIAAIVCALFLGGCVHLPDTAHGVNVATPAQGDITNATPLAAVIKAQHVEPLDPASPTPLLDQAMAELAKTDGKQRFRGIT